MAIAGKQVQRQAKRLFRWCVVNGELDEERVRRAIVTVHESGRRGHLQLLRCFQRLLQLEIARHTAAVETPFVLPPDLRARTQERVQRAHGPRTLTKFIHRPELIGGMRIQVGCDVYDGTIKSKLELLKQHFRNYSQL
jgi:F-type H+-transporting ATPase subunit delta